jgi:hypothetical protein
MTAEFILYEAACLSLIWSCFCRLVKTDDTTVPQIRFAFWLLFVSGMLAALAPSYGWVRADWPVSVLIISFVVMQKVTSIYWAKVPAQFTVSEQAHEARR